MNKAQDKLIPGSRSAIVRYTFHVKPQLNRSRHQTTDEVWQSLNVRGVSSCSQPSSWRPICQPQTTVWAETMTSIRRRPTGGLLLRTIRFDERGILVPRSMNAFGAPLTMKGVEATTLECCLTTQPLFHVKPICSPHSIGSRLLGRCYIRNTIPKADRQHTTTA